MADRKIQTTLVIRGESKDAVRSLNLTEKELDKLVGKQTKATDVAQKYASQIGGVVTQVAKYASVAGGIAVTATAAMVSRQLSLIDSLAKTADKLGIATNELQALRFAAEQTGVGADKMDMSLQRMVRRLSEAAQGGGEAKKAIEELGLDAQALAAMSPDQAFRVIADAMQDVESQSDRVRLAFKFFDSEGVALVNTLAQGSAGLDEFARQAEVAGLNISRIDAAKIEQANDAINLSKQLFTGFAQQVTVEVAPVIADLATRIFNVAEETDGVGEVSSRVFNFVVGKVGEVADTYHRLNTLVLQFELAQKKAAEATLDLFNKTQRFAVGIGNFLNPFGPDADASNLASFKRQSELLEEIAELQALINERSANPPSAAITEYLAGVERRSTEAAASVGRLSTELEQLADPVIIDVSAAATEANAQLDRMAGPIMPGVATAAVTVTQATTQMAGAMVGAREQVSKFDMESANMIRNIQREWGDELYNLLDEGELRFESFFDAVLDGFKRMVAEMVSADLVNAIFKGDGSFSNLASIFGGGGGASAGNLASAGMQAAGGLGLIGSAGQFIGGLTGTAVGTSATAAVGPPTAAAASGAGFGAMLANPWLWGGAALAIGASNDWWRDPDGYQRSNAGILVGPTPGLKQQYNAGDFTFESGFSGQIFDRRADDAVVQQIVAQYGTIDQRITDLTRQLGLTVDLSGATLAGVGEDGVGPGTFMGAEQFDQFAQQIVELIAAMNGLSEVTSELNISTMSAEEIISLLEGEVARNSEATEQNTASTAENTGALSQSAQASLQSAMAGIQMPAGDGVPRHGNVGGPGSLQAARTWNRDAEAEVRDNRDELGRNPAQAMADQLRIMPGETLRHALGLGNWERGPSLATGGPAFDPTARDLSGLDLMTPNELRADAAMRGITDPQSMNNYYAAIAVGSLASYQQSIEAGRIEPWTKQLADDLYIYLRATHQQDFEAELISDPTRFLFNRGVEGFQRDARRGSSQQIVGPMVEGLLRDIANNTGYFANTNNRSSVAGSLA